MHEIPSRVMEIVSLHLPLLHHRNDLIGNSSSNHVKDTSNSSNTNSILTILDTIIIFNNPIRDMDISSNICNKATKCLIMGTIGVMVLVASRFLTINSNHVEISPLKIVTNSIHIRDHLLKDRDLISVRITNHLDHKIGLNQCNNLPVLSTILS